MMIPQVDRLTKGRKIALCTIMAVFAAFLVAGTTWGRGGGGDDGGGGGRVHTSTTEQCTACHGSSLTTIHQESWSTSRTGCYICHPTGRRDLYDYLAGASFDCLSCHTLSGTPVDYHMNMDSKHTSTEAVCMGCHSTGTFAQIPIASLPQVHQGLGEDQHLPLTVDCPGAVPDIEHGIYCYCLECHVNPGRIPTLPDNANCTSCHEAGEYNAKLNQCSHEDILKALEEAGIDVTKHTVCINCHVPCTK
jgi:predicted CXXCH cytochrome family protein